MIIDTENRFSLKKQLYFSILIWIVKYSVDIIEYKLVLFIYSLLKTWAKASFVFLIVWTLCHIIWLCSLLLTGYGYGYGCAPLTWLLTHKTSSSVLFWHKCHPFFLFIPSPRNSLATDFVYVFYTTLSNQSQSTHLDLKYEFIHYYFFKFSQTFTNVVKNMAFAW